MAQNSKNLLKVRLRVVNAGEDAFGPGKAQLLESLIETGSLNQSASAMKMSYVKALSLIRAINTHFKVPMVTLSRGGIKGGGAEVTFTGRKVLETYHAMQQASERAAKSGWTKLQRYLK